MYAHVHLHNMCYSRFSIQVYPNWLWYSVGHIQSLKLIFNLQTENVMYVTRWQPHSQACYSCLPQQSCLVQKRGWGRWKWKRMNRQTDRHNGTVGHIHKSLWREIEKKKKSRQRGRQKITGRQSDRQAPNGHRERKADNRFSIISYAGNIVLLSTVMPISHDWISLLEASTLKPSLDSKHPSTSIEWSGEEAGYDPGSIYTTIQSLLVHSLSVYYDLNSSWWGRERGLYFPPKLSFKFISTNALFNSVWSKVPHNCIHT